MQGVHIVKRPPPPQGQGANPAHGPVPPPVKPQVVRRPPPPPPARQKDILDVGQRLYENPSLFKTIRHSRFADPFRRKSAYSLFQGAAQLALGAIPFPGLKELAQKMEEKGANYLKGKYANYKRAKAQNLEHQVKWDWKKGFNIEQFDRYRFKVKHGLDEVKKSYDALINSNADSTSICNDASKAYSKFLYLEHRIGKFRQKIAELKVMAEETDQWLASVQEVIDKSDLEHKVMVAAAKAHEWGNGSFHLDCKEDLCVYGDTDRIWEDEAYTDFRDTLGKIGGALLADATALFPDIAGLADDD